VLKNGKRFEIPEGYEVRGNFIVFKTPSGQLTQLPAKVVDLDKSKTLTQEMIEKRKQKELARIAAEKEALKRQKTDRFSDMSAIADYVEKTRGKENPQPTNVSIGDDTITDYNKTNPRPVNSTASHESFDVKSASDRKAAREEFGSGYVQLHDDLEKLKGKLAEAKNRRDNNASIAYQDDAGYAADEKVHDPNVAYDPESDETPPAYRQMEKAEQDVAKYEKEIQEKEAELQKYERQAQKAGVKDVKRYKERQDRKKELKNRKTDEPEYAYKSDDGTDSKTRKIKKYEVKIDDGSGNNDNGSGNNDN
jgi:ParB-like chromosome segregation protein Spo0J